jgi:DNA polymerase delta subunit 1
MKFAVKKAQCLGCKVPLNSKESFCIKELDNAAVCDHCLEKVPELLCRQIDTVKNLEVQFSSLWTQCQRCQGSLHQDVIW